MKSAHSSGEAAAKKPRGRPFQKGQSGNPAGRAAADPNIKAALRAATPQAVELLVGLIVDEKADLKLRMQAACTVLDRVLGDMVVGLEDASKAGKRLELVRVVRGPPTD